MIESNIAIVSRRIVDRTGDRYGSLVVIAQAGRNANGSVKWRCLCDCGKEYVGVLWSGVLSCGCSRKAPRPKNRTHGMKGTRTYGSWMAMKTRCLNPNRPEHWPRYGGRGITVCSEWLDFSNFYRDMGERPEGMTLDRIDNDGNYEPGNCKWSTPKEQASNRHDAWM